MAVSLVVAYARNGVIGRDGELPWHLPSDMQHFRELTTGGTVVMGRTTYGSIPERFRPLPGRRNLVLSRDPGFCAPGAEVFASLPTALEACGRDCFVIGGAATYAEALPQAARVYATEIAEEVDGDTSFPALGDDWVRVSNGGPIAENGHSFRICIYERR